VKSESALSNGGARGLFPLPASAPPDRDGSVRRSRAATTGRASTRRQS
jgi:hypothetical protein